ncbi:MAG TPA: ATP-binding protein, partial [Planctomycetota bacterium]
FLDLDMPLLQLDAGRVRQALLNLVINARQALGENGGQITLITRRERGEAILEVVDDGPGMSSETLSRCQEVYYSTKRGGSGLGLAMVRRIVEAHGGRVEIESELGHGTRMRLRFPQAPLRA